MSRPSISRGHLCASKLLSLICRFRGGNCHVNVKTLFPRGHCVVFVPSRMLHAGGKPPFLLFSHRTLGVNRVSCVSDHWQHLSTSRCPWPSPLYHFCIRPWNRWEIGGLHRLNVSPLQHKTRFCKEKVILQLKKWLCKQNQNSWEPVKRPLDSWIRTFTKRGKKADWKKTRNKLKKWKFYQETSK